MLFLFCVNVFLQPFIFNHLIDCCWHGADKTPDKIRLISIIWERGKNEVCSILSHKKRSTFILSRLAPNAKLFWVRFLVRCPETFHGKSILSREARSHGALNPYITHYCSFLVLFHYPPVYIYIYIYICPKSLYHPCIVAILPIASQFLKLRALVGPVLQRLEGRAKHVKPTSEPDAFVGCRVV